MLAAVLYSYRVRACTVPDIGDLAADDIRCSSWVSGVSVNVHSLSNTSALNLDGGGSVSRSQDFTVTWSSVAGAAVYVLSESVDGAAAQELPALDAANTSLDFSGKEYGKTYTYTLKACVGDGSATDFTCVDQDGASLSVEVKLPAPGSLSSDETASYDRVYELNWDTVTDAVGYQLQESSNSGTNWTNLSGIGTSSYESSGNGVGTYSYRVRACTVASAVADSLGDGDDVRCSNWTNIGAVVTVIGLANSSTLSSNATNDISNDGSYTISWTAVTGASVYILSESVDGTETSFASQTGTSESITGRTYGKSYSLQSQGLCGGRQLF